MQIKIIIRSTAYLANPLSFSKRKEKLPHANQNVTGARRKIQLSIHIYMFKGLDNYGGLVKRLKKERQKYSPGCTGSAQILEPSQRIILKPYRAIFPTIKVNPKERDPRLVRFLSQGREANDRRQEKGMRCCQRPARHNQTLGCNLKGFQQPPPPLHQTGIDTHRW